MIGTLIKKIRESKGYSQEYIADEINISQSAYSDLENNKTKLDLVRLQKIANVLQVNLTSILNGINALDLVNKSFEFHPNSSHYFFKQLIVQYEKRLKEKDEIIELLKFQLLNK